MNKENIITYIKNLENLYDELTNRVEKEAFEGYDPRLFWYLPLAKRYSKNPNKLNNLLRKIEVAGHRFLPFLSVRYLKLCKIPKVINPYGLGLLIQSYLISYNHFHDKKYLKKAIDTERILRPLLTLTKNNFLGVSVPLENPDITNLPSGAEVGLCYLDLYDATNSIIYFEIAKNIALSFTQDHTVKKLPDSSIMIDYYSSNSGDHILNANALAALVLHRVSSIEKNELMDNIVLGIKKYLDNYILEKALPYAGKEDILSNKNWNYCDSYHTSFTLRAYGAIWGLPQPAQKIWENYLDQFLNKNKIVALSKNSYLIDIHGTADFIKLYSYLIEKGLSIELDDLKLVDYNIKYMQYKDSFYYQRSIIKNSIFMPRWGHYPMMLAISSLIASLHRKIKLNYKTNITNEI